MTSLLPYPWSPLNLCKILTQRRLQYNFWFNDWIEIFKRTTILRQITYNAHKENINEKDAISSLWTSFIDIWEGGSSRKVKKVTHQCQTKLTICAELGSRPWSPQTLDRTVKSHLIIIRCKDLLTYLWVFGFGPKMPPRWDTFSKQWNVSIHN